MNNTPRSNRIHIAIFGKRNCGKSSFMNRFLGQDYSIVSNTPGTTTDPVEKSYELQPIGPVVIIDTAGIDDEGDLGKKRIEKTHKILRRTDIALLLFEKGDSNHWDDKMVELLQKRNTPFIIIVSKSDLIKDEEESAEKLVQRLKAKWNIPVVATSAQTGEGFEEVKNSISQLASFEGVQLPIIEDLVVPKRAVILVIPIDKEAPKGRIILPQVQTIRELLDKGVPSIICRETELKQVLSDMKPMKPQLVVTDSQAFEYVSSIVPPHIPLTSFSILFSRHKGDLDIYVKGLNAIESLKDGDHILIAELCSHRPIGEDIGRIKIPRWLQEKTGKSLKFTTTPGRDFPEDLSPFSLIIQCGGCMVNRKSIISRIDQAVTQKIPITNYGLTIAKLNNITNRVLTPLTNTKL
jgi:[FeFe] hydrogenase H-cluster maturation GTPase HydF